MSKKSKQGDNRLQELETLAKEMNVEISTFPDKIFIRTGVGEWFFSTYEERDIKLFHYNYFYRNTPKKFMNDYHLQNRRFSSWTEILNYIYDHDSKKYNPKKVKKCRMERLFDKLDAEKGRMNRTLQSA